MLLALEEWNSCSLTRFHHSKYSQRVIQTTKIARAHLHHWCMNCLMLSCDVFRTCHFIAKVVHECVELTLLWHDNFLFFRWKSWHESRPRKNTKHNFSAVVQCALTGDDWAQDLKWTALHHHHRHACTGKDLISIEFQTQSSSTHVGKDGTPPMGAHV